MKQPTTKILFDDAIDAAANAIVSTLGIAALKSGTILRDATGLISFASSYDQFTGDQRSSAETEIRSKLGAYARPDRPIMFVDDPGAKSILTDLDRLPILTKGGETFLLDRRIIGSGWLAKPQLKTDGPPRVVFASLKGGVGRSTALAFAAADNAARGKNILAIDLDLEAPGLGEILLNMETMPRLGVSDYLVENGIGGVGEELLADFVGVSSLTVGFGGRVDVIPGFGLMSQEYPQNILAKLARALIDDVSEDGKISTVSNQISDMIRRFSDRGQYDMIFIDSRAGLAELTAPAILGLGATVLLFGTAQQQTIAGYRAWFAALKLLAQRSVENHEPADWRLMFKPVYAKASLDSQISDRHVADLYDLFADNLYDEEGMEDALSFLPGDPDAPHAPLIIPFDPRFVDFDPSRRQNQLTRTFYEQTFRSFLDGLDFAMESAAATMPPELRHE